MPPLSEIQTEELVQELRNRRLVDLSTEQLEEELARREEEAWASAKNTDPIQRRIDVDAALANRVPTSPPQKIHVGGDEYTVVFREMGTKQAHEADTYSEGYIVKLNAEADLPYEHINSPVAQERIGDEKVVRIIHRVCLKPGAISPRAMFDLDHLRAAITDKEKTEIMRKYEAWHSRDFIESLADLSQEEFNAIVEGIKKNGGTGSFWIAFAWIALVRYALTSVNHPDWLQTGSVKDTSS